jgi:hypothetical protein
MVDLDNIKDHTVPAPEKWNVFGSLADFEAFPETHKQQILFLGKDARRYLIDFLHNAGLITGGGWAPFSKGNFAIVEEYKGHYFDEENSQLKKWLYRRGIPFRSWVFLLSNSDVGLMITWKMVVKYAHLLLGFDDTIVFDRTLNWCLSYYHENDMFFGKNNTYDTTEDEAEMQRLNERKQKFPMFRHPYLD